MGNQLMKFNALPEEVQNKIKQDLITKNRTNVWFEFGKYDVTPEFNSRPFYGADRKFIGSFSYDDLKDAIPMLRASRAVYLAGCTNIDIEME